MNKSLAQANRRADTEAGRIAVWVGTPDGWHRWVNYRSPDDVPMAACGRALDDLHAATTKLPPGAERHEACR